MLALLIAGLVSVIAMALIAVGLRGRRVGAECRCARCGFDLTGHGVTATRRAADVVCPECGAVVNDARGIRIGVRRRRWVVLCCGVILFVAGTGVGVPLWRARAAGTNVYPHLPTRMLLWELPWAGDLDATLISRELAMRLAVGKLSDGAARSLIATAIDLHTDIKRPFPDALGGVIAYAMEDDRVSPGQFERYWASLLAPTVKLRGSSPPWVGEEFAIEIDDGARSAATVMSIARSPRPLMVERRVTLSDSSAEPTRHVTVGGAGSPGGQPFEVGGIKAPDEPGEYELTVEVTYRVLWEMLPKTSLSEAGMTSKGLGTQKFMMPLRYAVSTKDSAAPTLFKDVSLEPALKALCGGLRPTLLSGPEGSRFAAMPAFSFPKAPCDVAFDVYWRADGREWKVASVATGKGLVFNSPTGAPPLEDFKAEKVDVVFRTNIAVAKQAPFPLKRVWDGEIVFEGVVPASATVGGATPPRLDGDR